MRHVIVMRKVAETIRLTVWERWLAAVDEGPGLAYCTTNKTDRRITLPNVSTIDFVGADDPQKLKSLEGITDIVMEEATEFDEIDFDTMDAGLSASCDPPPQIWLMFNPIPTMQGVQHWIQRRWLTDMPEPSIAIVRGDACILRTTYRDNYFCPEATKRLLEGFRLSNPALYKLWGLGEFTTLEGAILTDWDVVPVVPDGIECVGYGLDFGFSDDPSAVVQVWRLRNELWVKQIVYSTGLTNPVLSRVMEEAGMQKRQDWILADSADPKSIRELADMGWSIGPGEKGPDYKRAAAVYLQGLKIHALAGSTDLIRELGTWCWEVDRKSRHAEKPRFLPVPRDGDDHAIDALIYRVFRAGGVVESAYTRLRREKAEAAENRQRKGAQ